MIYALISETKSDSILNLERKHFIRFHRNITLCPTWKQKTKIYNFLFLQKRYFACHHVDESDNEISLFGFSVLFPKIDIRTDDSVLLCTSIEVKNFFFDIFQHKQPCNFMKSLFMFGRNSMICLLNVIFARVMSHLIDTWTFYF